MSKLRQADRGYWIVLAICFLAIWPFLKHASLPHDTDAELHIFRLAELQRMWAGGTFYPRWAANFYYGFGYPIFNYYAPLTYYIGLLWMLLPGVGAVLAIKLVFITAICGAGLSMYSFVRDEWGAVAGFVAAASYVYAPYILYVDSHARGVVPETFSFAIFPLALMLLNRLRRQPSATNFASASVAIACVILVHNLMAMVFGTLLFAWFVWQLFFRVGEAERPFLQRPFLRYGALAFACGVALSAFFWLPMALEQGAIQIASVVGEGSHYDYRNHFLSLSELLSSTLRLDWGATEPHYRLNLGVAQWVLALLGCLSLPFQPRADRRKLAFFAFVGLALLFLILPASQGVWQRIPLLPFLQFPWRLIGAANAMLAILGGVGVVTFGKFATQRFEPLARLEPHWATGAILSIMLLGLPLTQIERWDVFGPTEARDVMISELSGRWRGTTSTADFVPITVIQEPRPEQTLIDALLNAQPSDRLNPFVLGEAQVESEIVTPVHYRFRVDTPHLYIMRLYLFDFPGWTATIDGESVPVKRAEPEGFITVDVPIGQHVVDVQFVDTPPRQAGWAIALFALLSIGGIAWRLSRRGQMTNVREVAATQLVTHRPMLIAVLSLVVLSVFVLEPMGVLYMNSAENEAQPASDSVLVPYGDQLNLIGYSAPESIQAGQKIRIDLYWKAQQPLDDNWQVFVHLLSPDTAVLTQSDKLNPGDFPTEQWPTDKYIRDPHWLVMPDNLPSGTYRLTAGIWSIETGQRLPATDPAGEWFVLRELVVK